MEGGYLGENIDYLGKTEVQDRNNVNEEKSYIGTTENEWLKDIIIISWFSKTVNMKMRQRCPSITGKLKEKLPKITWIVFFKKATHVKNSYDMCRLYTKKSLQYKVGVAILSKKNRN